MAYRKIYLCIRGIFFYIVQKIGKTLSKKEKLCRKGRKFFTNDERFYIMVIGGLTEDKNERHKGNRVGECFCGIGRKNESFFLEPRSGCDRGEIGSESGRERVCLYV